VVIGVEGLSLESTPLILLCSRCFRNAATFTFGLVEEVGVYCETREPSVWDAAALRARKKRFAEKQAQTDEQQTEGAVVQW